MRPVIEHVDQLTYNAFVGYPCFIFATGPSIADEDLEPLRDHYTFGTGSIAMWDGLPFWPTLYGVDAALERVGGTERVIEAWDVVQKAGLCGFIRPMPSYSSTHWYNVGHPPMGREIADGELMGLTDFPVLRHIPTQTGISAFAIGLQPALWLGFDPIYFLGLDLTNTYVHGGNRNQEYARHEARMLRSVQVVYDRTRAAGRTVVNLSPVSNEHILPRDTLARVLGRMSESPRWTPRTSLGSIR